MKVNFIPMVVFGGAGMWLIAKGWEVYDLNPVASVLAMVNGFFSIAIGCFCLRVGGDKSAKKTCELPIKSSAANNEAVKNSKKEGGSPQLSKGQESGAIEINDVRGDLDESHDDESKASNDREDDKSALRVIELPECYRYPGDPFTMWHDEPLSFLEGDYVYFSSSGICPGIDLDRLCIKKDRAQFYSERGGQKNEIFREVTNLSWEGIVGRISHFPLKKWHGNEYCDHQILDGEKWVLSIRLDGGKIRCEASGRNSYPPSDESSDSDEDGSSFSDLRQLLNEFLTSKQFG